MCEDCKYTEVIPMKGKGQVPLALQDFIRYTGAPPFILVDGTPEENKGKIYLYVAVQNMGQSYKDELPFYKKHYMD